MGVGADPPPQVGAAVEGMAADDDPAVMIRRKLDPGPKFPWARVLAGCRLERLVP
mgnify:FL=1